MVGISYNWLAYTTIFVVTNWRFGVRGTEDVFFNQPLSERYIFLYLLIFNPIAQADKFVRNTKASETD